MISSFHHSKSAILLAVYKIIVKNKNTYCYPTRQTLLDLISKHSKVNISLSCIDEHLGDFKKGNIIKSFRQFGRNPDGTVFMKPSNRSFTLPGLNLIRTMGIKVEKYLWTWIFKGLHPSATRGPKLDPSTESPEQRSGDAESLGSILNKTVIPEIV